MLPSLKHIPQRGIFRIPGPPVIGSRRSVVTLGQAALPLNPGGGPDGAHVFTYMNANAGAPVWFAISDGGAGYIPWGYWQVAIYRLGDALPPSENLAFGFVTCENTDVAPAVMGQVWGKFNQLQAQGVAAGFKRAAEFTILPLSVYNNPSPDPRAQIRIAAPYGVNLEAFYVGPSWIVGEDPAPPMVLVQNGYDNPLAAALWGPQRALFKAVASRPNRYAGYPYPYEPYYRPEELPQ